MKDEGEGQKMEIFIKALTQSNQKLSKIGKILITPTIIGSGPMNMGSLYWAKWTPQWIAIFAHLSCNNAILNLTIFIFAKPLINA